MSAASGGNSEPKQGQRSQSARGFCPRSTMRVPQPDIIEHFGNADAVPQPPKRCLSRKAGIVRCCLSSHRISQLMLPIFHCFAVFFTVYSYTVQSFCFLLFKEGTTMPVKSPYTSALARRVTWQLTLTATGRQATWVGSCSMQTPRQVVAPPKPCGPKPVALMASNSSFSSAA